jgi:hypothetical protein
VLVLSGRSAGSAGAELVELFQRVRHRRAGDVRVSPLLADESIAASLSTVSDEEPIEGKILLVQERTHLRPGNVKGEANRRR